MSAHNAASRNVTVHTPSYLAVAAYVFPHHNNVAVTVNNGHGLGADFKLPAEQAEEFGRALIELAAQARENDRVNRAADAAAAAALEAAAKHRARATARATSTTT